jgi:hypothetical protein
MSRYGCKVRYPHGTIRRTRWCVHHICVCVCLCVARIALLLLCIVVVVCKDTSVNLRACPFTRARSRRMPRNATRTTYAIHSHPAPSPPHTSRPCCASAARLLNPIAVKGARALSQRPSCAARIARVVGFILVDAVQRWLRALAPPPDDDQESEQQSLWHQRERMTGAWAGRQQRWRDPPLHSWCSASAWRRAAEVNATHPRRSRLWCRPGRYELRAGGLSRKLMGRGRVNGRAVWRRRRGIEDV